MILLDEFITSYCSNFGGIDEPLTRIKLSAQSNNVLCLLIIFIILEENHGTCIHRNQHGVLAKVDVDENIGWFEISQKDLFI